MTRCDWGFSSVGFGSSGLLFFYVCLVEKFSLVDIRILLFIIRLPSYPSQDRRLVFAGISVLPVVWVSRLDC